MTTSQQTFLHILSASLQGQTALLESSITPEDWENIVSLAREHSVLPLIFEAAYPNPAVRQEPLMAALKPQILRQVMTQTMKTGEFLSLYSHLRKQGIAPLVIKGLVCRSLYPAPDHRQSGDEDVLIPPEQYDACHESLMDYGMALSEPEMDRESAYEVPYGKPGSPIYIELHKHLFPPESDAYGDLNRFFEGVFQRAVELTIQGQKILTMCPTDHFFYLICHSFKHFLHSGFGIRQVCDIALFAREFEDQINWPQVQENCRAIRAEKFTAALLRIGEVHLGIPAPDAWDISEIDEMPILQDLLSSGIYGGAEMSRKHSSTITLTAVAGQKQGNPKQNGLLKSLFPPVTAMEKRYPTLQRHPYLLPVFWAHRIVKYGTETRNSENNNAAEAIKIGSQRIALFKEYDILDN